MASYSAISLRYQISNGPDHRYIFLLTYLPHAIPQAAEVQAKEEAKKALKALPVRSDPGSMGWENHTKGFASKYLAKFGFKVR